jgi:hypothetical protein
LIALVIGEIRFRTASRHLTNGFVGDYQRQAAAGTLQPNALDR